MTAKEVAALFGKSITTIYNWRDKKLIHPIYSCPTNRGKYIPRQRFCLCIKVALETKGDNYD